MKARGFRTLLRWLPLVVALAWAVRQWAWMPLVIVGHSMQPTLPAGSIVGLNKLAYRSGPPRRGDVVAVWTGWELIVKRVVGLPGEEIGMTAGGFCVNGSPLAEPYSQFRGPNDIAPGRLGADRFVIAGDNRQATLIAVISRDRIVGRVVTWR